MAMNEVSRILYSPPIEEESTSHSWDKMTINFALESRAKLMAVINKKIKEYGLLGRVDPAEVYQEFLIYLLGAEDYDFSKSRGTIGDYVIFCLKSIIKRFVSNFYKYDSMLVYNTIYEDDELSVLDLVPDCREMPECISVSDALKYGECLRYKYGIDIPLLVFLRFICDNDEKYRQYVELLLGIKDLAQLERKLRHDEHFIVFINILSNANKAEAIAALKRIVYGAESIERALMDE